MTLSNPSLTGRPAAGVRGRTTPPLFRPKIRRRRTGHRYWHLLDHVRLRRLSAQRRQLGSVWNMRLRLQSSEHRQ
jgi:hypothetical protein